LIGAADTFRAAAVEQLEVWAKRVGTDLIKQSKGSDPSAVAFDSIHAAKARDTDLVFIDTAGRLHTKVNLMEELKKVKRIIGRECPGAPHEVLLVLDATTGQNGISQAKFFNESIGVTGIALTKLDGTAKGGIIIGITEELKIPIRYIGIGEGLDDLREFNASEFVQALF
jgi:fused signal recognition particle receptor